LEVVLSMCFSRRSSWREEDDSTRTREGRVWELFDRELEAERPRPIADRARAERDAEESREGIPVGVGG
jgi:hypothetical protein